MASAMAALPSLDNTYGALQIGITLATFLEGALTLQTYIYFQSFPNDRPFIRYLVGTVWILDTIHLGMVSALQYGYVITNYANPAVLGDAFWTFGVAIILTTIITLLVQGFFTWRTLLITKSRIAAGIVGSLAFISFATGNACAGLSFHLVQYIKFLHFRWTAAIWLGCAAGCDILVSISLCWSLWNSRTGFKGTDDLLTTLIVWTVNTGLLTSIIAVIDLICFVTMDNMIHFAFNVALGKLYANMFVATLNQRLLMRKTMSAGASQELEDSQVQFPKHSGRILHGQHPSSKGNLKVHVSSTTQQSGDPMPIKMLPVDTYGRAGDMGTSSTFDTMKSQYPV